MAVNQLTWLALVLAVTLTTVTETATAKPRIVRNVVYGMYSGLALLMDIHYPVSPNGLGIIFIPGSGWRAPLTLDAAPLKENAEGTVYAVPLVATGYTVFTINHRASPRFQYPAAVKDAQRAVRFIRYHATDFGIDPHRIGALGGSSGGYLATLLGVLDDRNNAIGDSVINQVSAKVQAVVARGAGTDFRSCCGDGFPDRYVGAVSAFLGYALQPDADTNSPESQRYAEASSITHVSSDDAPLLMLHGEADDIVPITQAESMQQAYVAAGVPVSLFRIPGGGHDDTFGGVSNPPDYIGAMVNWFDRYLR